MSTAHLLQAAARRHPGAPALTDRRGTWRYGEFFSRVCATAAWLRARPGVAPGARVAIAMENSAGFLQVLWGCWHAGLCAVPINAKLHPKEFAYILANSGATLCFASPALHPGIAAALESDTVMVEADDGLLDRIAAGVPMAIEERAPTDPAWLFYTSGTTGRPKGATQCHRNLLFLSHAYTADIDPLDERDTILHPAPLSHGSGAYSVPHVAHASHNVIPASGHFEAGETLALIERFPNVSFFAAPTLVVRMLADGSIGHAKLDHLKTIAYGGAPMYVSDLERALEVFGPRLYQLFGQGESPMTITGLDKRSHFMRELPGHRERLASAGWARTGVEVRVVDEDDRDLPAGEVGEIITRSDCVMLGYWENPQANAKALRGGWLHTGDLGSLDETGMLTLKDRSKDMIISGGTNIYPREIEDVLLGHPGVREASVVGAPHPDWGEEVVAFVVTQPGAVVAAAALDARCLEHIARFKRPKRYLFVEALPKNNYGKVLKTALRQKLADEKAS